MMAFGVLALDQRNCATASTPFSKYSSLMAYLFPAISAIEPDHSVDDWLIH